MNGMRGRAAFFVPRLVFGATCLFFAGPARAQSDEDRATARAAATQGLAAEESGNFAESVELFKRAEAIVHAPPHLLHIARGEARLGHLVAAQESYVKITREELASSAPKAFVEAQAAAQQELAELKPRIPSLKIVVEGGKGKVTLDGAPVPDALVGIARPIDPGRHQLKAMGHHLASAPATVEIAEGAHESVTLKLEPSADADIDEPAKPTTTAPEEKRGSNVPAFVAWGIGVAGVAVGTAMVFVNRGKREDAEKICPPGPCFESRRAEVEALDSDADQAATLAWIGYSVGAVGLGVGTVLFLTNRKSSPKESARAVTPWVSLGGAGLQGRF